MNQESVEALAEQLAAHGRDALIERLRAAFADAAAAHADIVELDEQKLEALVQSSADRADGLQWRRALATLAADALGVPVTEALTHPAVARAQELVGAPSYEHSLAELIRRPVPEAEGAAIEAEAHEPGPAEQDPSAYEQADYEPPEPETVEPETVEPETVEPETAWSHEEPPAPAVESGSAWGSTETATPPAAEQAPETETEAGTETEGETGTGTETETETTGEDGEQHTLRVAAVHLGGVANLPTDDRKIDLRLSDVGLDIMREHDEIMGRLGWDDIEALEVPAHRGRLRRRTPTRAQLVVRTAAGDASFEIPAFSSDELRERVDALFVRYGRK